MEDTVKNEFVFYFKLARPMVLNLPESRDRILAVAWLRKLSDENVGDERLRTTYLKLLIFCLQRRRLSGIFGDDPRLYEVLENLASNIDLNECARNLLKQERQGRHETTPQEMGEDIAAFPPFTTDCSPDLTEYAAVQNIPNFGVHAYYAISKHPVNKWQRSELAIFPKGTKSATGTSITITASATPKDSASAPAVEGADASAPIELPSQEKKKRRPRKLGSSPPTRPLGHVKRATVERLTPTWGTNLVHVRGRTDIGEIKDTSGVDKALKTTDFQIIEDEQTDEERNAASRGAEHKSLASKPKEITYAVNDFKYGMMEKAKIQPPSRFTKLEDRSGLQDLKSSKRSRVKVKSTKEKGTGNKDLGPRLANPSEEFNESIKKALEEADLTWQDLMSGEEDIDEEIQEIQDEVLRKDDYKEFQIENLDLERYGESNCDGFCREIEGDVVAHKTVYDKGVEEDEELIEWLQDQIEEVEEQKNIFREAQEMRSTSSAISRRIPITTPQLVTSPRRVKSAEKVYAEATDNGQIHRQSYSCPLKKAKRHVSIERKPKRSIELICKVHGLLKIIDENQKAAKAASKQYSTRDDSDESVSSQKEFQQELNENRRNRGPRPSPSPYGTEMRGMCPPNYRKAGGTGEVAIRKIKKTVGNQYGMEALNAVRKNLFGSRREATEVPEPTVVKHRNMHDLRHWEQVCQPCRDLAEDKLELMQELQQHPIDFLGVAENCTSSQREEDGFCDQDFREFMHNTPQTYIEEVMKQHRHSPQMRRPSLLRREAHPPSHDQLCMSHRSPEELGKFRQFQREIEQLSKFLPELEAEIEETRRAAWRDIEGLVMELYPTIDKGNETGRADSLSPQKVHSTRISSGGLHSPGSFGFWDPCEIEQNDEHVIQAMPTEQGPMLDGPHMHEYPGGYHLPESLSSHIIKECGMTRRQVDEMMFYIEHDQSVDNETLPDCEIPCTSCILPPRLAEAIVTNEERRRTRQRHNGQ
ncbi:uncharacterized protein [Euwallacea fornicatus]|uniref:uncharacterized protein isoform X3 n=1 Tax=Euwallacea fornicatus TaxID=995702 RepID=UPI0033903B5E